MPTDTSSITVYSAVIGGAAAAIFSGVFAIWNNWLTRRSEEQRALRELAMKMALENWKERREMAKFIGEKTQQTQYIPPVDVFIIHMLKVSELVCSKKLTPENVGLELTEIWKITNAAAKAMQEH